MTADFVHDESGSWSSEECEAVLEALRGPSLATALRILGDRSQAEDAVQDAYVKATGAIGQIRNRASVGSWFRRIVVRCSLDALATRTSLRESQLVDGPAGTDQKIELQWALDRLKPEQQVVLALAFGDGLSHREIADALDCPMGTVASRIHSAKAAFRKVWEDNHD